MPPFHPRLPLLLWLVLLSQPVAAQAPPNADTPPPPDVAAPASASQAWTQRAAHIRALAEGQLEPEIDAASLFELPLHDPALAGTDEHLVVRLRRAIDELRAIDALPRYQRKRRRAAFQAARAEAPSVAPADATAAAVLELEAALLDFFALDRDTRKARFEAHDKQRTVQRAHASALDRAQADVKRMQQEVTHLTALFEGALPLEVDPQSLLRVNLVPDALVAAASPEPEAGSELAARLLKVRRLRSERDALRLRFARMQPADRAALLTRHTARRSVAEAAVADEVARKEAADDAQREAVRAEQEREAALQAAEAARSEGQRMIAAERARLLAIKAQLSELDAQINRAHEGIAAHHDQALEWSGKARQLQTRLASAREMSHEAHAQFQGVLGVLGATRSRLHNGRVGTLDVPEVPSLGPALDGSVRAQLDTAAIDTLRAELSAQRMRLQLARDELRWASTDALMQDLGLLNDTRLTLLGLMGDRHRARYTGTGPDGVRQAQGEAEMIVLATAHRMTSIPRHVQRLREDLSTSPVPLLWAATRVCLCIWIFLWWRRRADSILAELQRPGGAGGDGLLSSRARVAVWYLRRVRKPLEWLALFAVLTSIAELDGFEAEIGLVRVVLLWTMTGALVVNLVDAIAARQQLSWTSQTDTSELRTRSLRVVGIAIVAAGLVLALSEQAVGRGTIDEWIRTVCAFFAVPLLLVVVHWWRPTIFERLKRLRTPDVTVRWVLQNERGLMRYPAATVGGGYLVFRGVVRWVAGWAGELEAVKRLMAHLFRSEVARQEGERSAAAGQQPIDEAQQRALREPTPDDALLTEVAGGALEEACAAARTGRSFCAVVGERGIGKSTLLSRVATTLDDRTVHVVRCPMGGFSAVLRRLCETFELPEGLSEEDLCARLRERLKEPVVVCLDDAQRLIRPTIGGLEELDHLAHFARELGDVLSWVVAVEGPSFRFLERARGQRLLFDRVIRLRPWSEAQIAELMRRASERQELEPDFSDLVVPSRFDDPDESNEARAERGYYRILWDYAGGNPSVAQYFWSESLVTRDSQLRVRLFPTPALSDLEELPSTVHFVLRTILQLELASEPAIVDCTNLAPAEVADAVRFITARGYVDRVQRHVRIARGWYRAITTVLRRQHLLAGS